MTDKLTRIRELAEKWSGHHAVGWLADRVLAILNESEPAGAGPCNCVKLLKDRANEFYQTARHTGITESVQQDFIDKGTQLRGAAHFLSGMLEAEAALRGAAQPTPAEQVIEIDEDGKITAGQAIADRIPKRPQPEGSKG